MSRHFRLTGATARGPLTPIDLRAPTVHGAQQEAEHVLEVGLWPKAEMRAMVVTLYEDGLVQERWQFEGAKVWVPVRQTVRRCQEVEAQMADCRRALEALKTADLLVQALVALGVPVGTAQPSFDPSFPGASCLPLQWTLGSPRRQGTVQLRFRVGGFRGEAVDRVAWEWEYDPQDRRGTLRSAEGEEGRVWWRAFWAMRMPDPHAVEESRGSVCVEGNHLGLPAGMAEKLRRAGVVMGGESRGAV